jgi:adenine phosphoribosyltransferase
LGAPLQGDLAVVTPSIASFIRTIPDHPKPGILFRDVSGLLEDPLGLRLAVDRITDHYMSSSIDFLAAIEARGFIFGAAVAYNLGVGFLPLRKKGKLPGEVIGVDYELEYGSDRLEMQTQRMHPGASVLLVDDLIATGGTADAAIELIHQSGGYVHSACFVIDLPDLGGSERIRSRGCDVFSLCQFDGH